MEYRLQIKCDGIKTCFYNSVVSDLYIPITYKQIPRYVETFHYMKVQFHRYNPLTMLIPKYHKALLCQRR